ncbi:STAS domain-containing protein [Lusitaniella coriacea LEGE 07157]|uniref:STAS domain-containing protein n=1 Tax=Lusitaniella coriacea LEGE 07157 TaxID=945747 RepID=A0A8J7B3W5_9CYAN|nr:STAS domain-containing protein [Lusitaniella coriacea]MBE9115397.1 STAS domain-containing protein [Lusitaniella coriacea LEGE 07157]
MYVVLRPQGNLDVKRATLLKHELLHLTETTDGEAKSYWVIDCAQVQSIDHFGLFTLVELRQLAHQRKCHLRLCNLSKQLRLVFEITELDGRLRIWDKKVSDASMSQYPMVLC